MNPEIFGCKPDKVGNMPCDNGFPCDKCQCPLGGDKANDCADCAYSCDHHFVNGECIRREEEY